MKLFELKLRLIAPLAGLCFFVLVLSAGPGAFAQTPRATAVSIAGATQSGLNTTYSYAVTSTGGGLTDLAAGETIFINGMAAGTVAGQSNNGTFTISALTAGVSFTVANPNGFTTTTAQSGVGTVIFGPESGALVEITSSDNSILEKVYDSQVHDGSATEPVGTVPASTGNNGSNCNASDTIPSDAYLQQAQAPTGCDPGDQFESTLTFVGNTSTPNVGNFDFAPGMPQFHVSSQYVCLSNNTVAQITQVSQDAGTNTTTYTYSLVSGPPLQVGEAVIISGLNPTGNNSAPDPTSTGAFIITGLQNGTFNVFNPNGAQQFDQSGTAVSACGATPLTVSSVAQNGGATTFTYSTAGPALTTSLLPTESVQLTGFTGAFANNTGMFPITNLQIVGGVPTFDVANHASGALGSVTTNANVTSTNNTSGTTTYTYDPTSLTGPAFTAGENVTITCFTSTLVGNNGTFANLSAPTGTTFSAVNPAGVNLSPMSNQTQIFNITSVVNNGDGTTTYTYAGGIGGPALQLPTTGCPLESMTITGLTPAGDNGTFTIQNRGVGTVTLNNATGITTQVNISGATVIDVNTMRYAFTPAANSTSPLVNGQNVTISGFMNTMTDPMGGNDNGTFTISNVAVTTFDVTNGQVPSGVTTTGTQNATGLVSQSGSANGTATQVGLATAMPVGTAAMTNTNRTVFSNDTGFVTITNNTGAQFNGTIQLSGEPGNPTACPPPAGTPPIGQTETSISDMVTSGLASGASVVLALSNDSSSCGGFNQPQTQPLVTNVTNTYPIGKDFFQITPISTINANDQFSVLPVPEPAGPLGAPPAFGPFSTDYLAPMIGSGSGFGNGQFGQITPPASPLRFSAFNFPGRVCVPVADFSASRRDTASPANAFGPASENPVCPLLQVTCVNGSRICSDADTFLYTGNLGFTADTVVGNGIGGVHYIGQHDTPCPTTHFTIDDLVSYTGSNPGIDYPSAIGGRGNSCFANIYDPNVTATANGTTVTTFVGFQNPVVNCPTAPPGMAPPPCAPQPVTAGSTIPLIWQSKDSSGNPVTGLTLCPRADGTFDGVNPCGPPPTPWVFVELAPITCPSGTVSTTTLDDLFAGSSALQTLSPPGTYQFNFKTSKSQRGFCFASVLGFSNSGWVVRTAEFALK